MDGRMSADAKNLPRRRDFYAPQHTARYPTDTVDSGPQKFVNITTPKAEDFQRAAIRADCSTNAVS